jgi:hypothetical protein
MTASDAVSVTVKRVNIQENLTGINARLPTELIDTIIGVLSKHQLHTACLVCIALRDFKEAISRKELVFRS